LNHPYFTTQNHLCGSRAKIFSSIFIFQRKKRRNGARPTCGKPQRVKSAGRLFSCGLRNSSLFLDDRIEIHTPGKPPNTIKEAVMRAGAHVVRNPRLYARLSPDHPFGPRSDRPRSGDHDS